jgi:hypothetical protein
MPFFRTFGLGSNINDAFMHAKIREGTIHPDLSERLDCMRFLEIEKKEPIDGFELELRVFITQHALTWGEKRDLTQSEEKTKNWFLEHYKNEYEEYLECYNNIDDNKCLAVKLSNTEKQTWKRKNNCFGKKGDVWIYFGHTQYQFTDED